MSILRLGMIGIVWFASCALGATPQQVDDSIRRGVAALYAMQGSNGGWEEIEQPNDALYSTTGWQWGSTTAFALYALLEAGENANDPRIVKGVEFLKKTPSRGAYTLAARCLLWSSMGKTTERDRLLRADTQLLVRSMRDKMPARGLFWYPIDRSVEPAKYDHSISQMAILALQAAHDAGANVPEGLWAEADAAFRRNQRPDGSWCYSNHEGGTAPNNTISMTTAGVATLFNTQIHLAGANPQCRGNLNDPNVDAGMKWIEQRFEDTFNPSTHLNRWDLTVYVLFNLQRAAAASGYSRIGTIDWFQRGADWLIKTQQKEGHWNWHYSRPAGASLAILFLRHGRSPLAFNKLQYSLQEKEGSSQIGHWNQRPRDVANLSRWLGRQLERRINWQIVDLSVPTAQLLEAPVMILTGNQTLAFSDQDYDKLREYIERGGLLVGNADCNAELFKNSFRKLGQKLFPSYEFRLLPEDHPIYTGQLYPSKRWKSRPSTFALSNGARELMILLPTDCAAPWQQDASGTKPEPFEQMADIFLFACERSDLTSRGTSLMVQDDPSIQTARSAKLARLQYGGNWNPEPGSWKQLAAIVRRDDKIKLDVETIPLGEGKLTNFKLAHLTGTTRFTFNDAQREEIRSFIKAGGTLLIDACGGSSDFATDVEEQLRALFPDAANQLNDPLPPTHALFKDAKGAPLQTDYRRFARMKLGNLKAPRLRGITVENRLAVIYSAEDLSVGLTGHSGDGVNGYTPQTATAIVRNLISQRS